MRRALHPGRKEGLRPDARLPLCLCWLCAGDPHEQAALVHDQLCDADTEVPHHVLVGAEVVCGRGQGWTGTLGFETACVLFKGNTLKARVNKNKEWAVVYIAKLVDNWTAAVTLDKNLKPGVLLTHS
ncbi:hypothetical protein TcBrA4_0115950 [Trypanosoma cruzi]|nr:hypothetical protein TcBrA4_0115950 [Trypanosoma cruzi]